MIVLQEHLICLILTVSGSCTVLLSNGYDASVYIHVEHGQPKDVVRSLLPVWNNFIFFDVNAVSFHQVSYVIVAQYYA